VLCCQFSRVPESVPSTPGSSGFGFPTLRWSALIAPKYWSIRTAASVSFPNHDGYFRADEQALKEGLLKAQRDKEEISFTFDRELNILKTSRDAG
jgi:hypothetical protein